MKARTDIFNKSRTIDLLSCEDQRKVVGGFFSDRDIYEWVARILAEEAAKASEPGTSGPYPGPLGPHPDA